MPDFARSTTPLLLHRYDGTENVFFVLDERHPTGPEYADLARRVCDPTREYGGADGLLVLLAPSQAGSDVRMRIFNADGSEAEMCGNGARCAARYLLEDSGEQVVLQTLAGPIRADLISRTEPFLLRIDVGLPDFRAAAVGYRASTPNAPSEIVAEPFVLDGRTWKITTVSLGNPHVVLFVDDVDAIDLATLGPRIERDPRFFGGVNVHFAALVDEQRLRVRHWERGSGATAACGTGAVASAVAALRQDFVRSPVRVDVPGGALHVEWAGARARLSGPAVVHGRVLVEWP